MKLSAVVFSAMFAVSMLVAGGAFAGASGKVDEVKNEGRQIVIGGKEIAISGSRTKVMINGAEGDRGAIQPGMTCTADVDSGEAATVDCK